MVRRRGAKPGDILVVTGLFVRTVAGLKILLEGLNVNEKARLAFIEAVLMSKAQLKEGFALSDAGVLTALIDSSEVCHVASTNSQRPAA